jgi:hypothetical protein
MYVEMMIVVVKYVQVRERLQAILSLFGSRFIIAASVLSLACLCGGESIRLNYVAANLPFLLRKPSRGGIATASHGPLST